MCHVSAFGFVDPIRFNQVPPHVILLGPTKESKSRCMRNLLNILSMYVFQGRQEVLLFDGWILFLRLKI